MTIRLQAAAQTLRQIHQQLFALFEIITVKITHDIVQLRLLNAAFHLMQMEKALIARGVLRRFARWQLAVKTHCQIQCVDHHAFCRAGMHIVTFDHHRGGGSIEVFKFKLANAAAIHGVGPVGAKTFDIKMRGAAADLFVRRKGDANGTVWTIAGRQLRHGGHDFSDTRFIISAQQRFTVGGN